jgi:hypothetical protein
MKDKARLSFNVSIGKKECREAQFQQSTGKSIQQAKEEKVRTVTPKNLDQWEKEGSLLRQNKNLFSALEGIQ